MRVIVCRPCEPEAFNPPAVEFCGLVLLGVLFALTSPARGAPVQTEVQSPNGRNRIVLQAADQDGHVRYWVTRDGTQVIRPSLIGPVLVDNRVLGEAARIVDVRRGEIDERFELRWSKTSEAVNRCSYAVVTLATPGEILWEVELRAFDDGVAFRYRLPHQQGLGDFELSDERTQFDVAGNPMALFNTLGSFTSSHESLYRHEPLSAVPPRKLIDMPILLTWGDDRAAAITEARVLNFAGGYLERPSPTTTKLQCRLAPLASREGVCVVGNTPHASPWRVILLADVAGKLLESNLLLCLNDPQRGDFDWLQAGKTTWHWWYGEFEEDYRLPPDSNASLERHKKYIDFCARNNIAYHAVSGDGLAWYQQSKTGYGSPADDADVRVPRPHIQLPEIIEYARSRGVGIRLWVHWKPLSEHLEEAFSIYESWGVQGLMVDFLNRDDQEMIEFTQRLLESAARHKLHIQFHGSSKFSGEQRTFPHLFNREGVLNLEFLKWSDLCTPDHNVNVAYTRGLTGPVDYHQGGFRSVSRADFQPRDRAPNVMGTRCHHLALYVVYENPLPMVADTPDAYEGQLGFDFIREVPTTWDETRFLAGEPGEFVIVARRTGETWYVGGINNWTERRIEVPLEFLGNDRRVVEIYVDGSLDEAQPNAIRRQRVTVSAGEPLAISMAPGGGLVAIVRGE